MEETLKKYLEDAVPIADLIKELNESVQMNKRNVFKIEKYKTDLKFSIEKSHLIKLCQACLENQLKLTDLTKISFILNSSDYFVWDNSTTEGKIVNSSIQIWKNLKNDDELTKEYIQYCAYFLETGEHR